MTISLFIAIPILFVLSHLFLGAGESWSGIVEHLLGTYILNSLRVGGLALLVSIVIGVGMAWIISSYEFPFRKVISWLLILPLAIPVYIMGYAYAGLFDYTGTITQLIGVRLDIMNWWGLSLVLAFSLFPYVYLSTRALFSLQNGKILEAARLLTNKRSKVFFKVAIPLAIPAIAAGGGLVLMEVLNDYGAAKYYNVKTFCTGIFHTWFALEEPKSAVFLAAILCVFIFMLIYVERFIRNRKRYVTSGTESVIKRIIPSNGQKTLYLSISVLVLGFTLFLPLIQLVEWALHTYVKVLDSEFVSIALQSVTTALLASFLCVIVAVALLSFSRWNRSEWVKRLSKLTILGYAIPAAVIAIGIFSPSLTIDKFLARTLSSISGNQVGLILNGTVILLVYGYIIRFMAVAFSPIESGYVKVHASLNEAAETLGSSKWKSLTKVDLPLIKFSLIGAWLLVFVDIMKELPLTLILKPYDMNTLAVKAYEYASDERIAECACPSLLIILVGCIPIIFLNRLIK